MSSRNLDMSSRSFQECVLPSLFPAKAGFRSQQVHKDKAAQKDAGRDSDEVLDLFESDLWKRNRAMARNRDHFRIIEEQPQGDTADVYGELIPEGVEHLMSLIPGHDLSKDDVFFDLGSGVGKVVVQIFLTSSIRHAVGIELDQSRHGHAVSASRALAKILSLDPHNDEGTISLKSTLDIDGRQLEFLQADVLKAQLKDATVVFVCSLAFPDSLVHEISSRLVSQLLPGSVVLTGKQPVGCHRGLKLLGQSTLAVSWTKEADMYIYMVTPEDSHTPAISFSVGTPSSPQNLRLSKQARGNEAAFIEHRLRGEQSSALQCDAQELGGVLSFNATQARTISSTFEFSGEMSQGQQLLQHFSKKRRVDLGIDRDHITTIKAHYSKRKGDVFIKHRMRKQNQSLDILQILMDHRADPRIRDQSGESVWTTALQSNDSLLLSVLRSRGCCDDSDHSAAHVQDFEL